MISSAQQTSSIEKLAPLFAALGDETRLLLVERLMNGEPESISQLSHSSSITRQGITKHLRVLEGAGIVLREQRGREIHYEINPDAFKDIEEYLQFVSQQWDNALHRLKSFVEEKP